MYANRNQPVLGMRVWCARHLAQSESVAVLLADDLILGTGCLGEMLSAYIGGNMVAVMDVPQNETASYGIVTPGADDGRIVEVNGLVEKPSPADAPSNIAVVGRYIIEPGVFTHLDRQEQGAGGEIQLTDSLARQIGEVPFSGCLLYTSPSPRDRTRSRMPSSA